MAEPMLAPAAESPAAESPADRDLFSLHPEEQMTERPPTGFKASIPSSPCDGSCRAGS
jgi:hypothetical protein